MENSIDYLNARIEALEGEVEELHQIIKLKEVNIGNLEDELKDNFTIDVPLHLRTIEVEKFFEDMNSDFETFFSKIKEYDI